MNVRGRATVTGSTFSIIAAAIVLTAPLLASGATSAGELADPSAGRTLVLALQVDREGGRLVAFTSKERAFVAPPGADAPRAYATSELAQIEVVLLGPGGARYTRQVTVAGLCLDHGPDAAPEIQEDTIRLHRESFLVEEPELAGFDRIEIAYYTGDALAPTRKVLGVADLDAAHFTSAGTASRYENLAIAKSDREPASSSLLTPGTVHFPEEYGDPELTKIYGNAAETTKRINVVIVPDGYTYAQKATMQAHAQAMVDAFRAKSPYKEHDRFLNYILVYAYSTQDGTDQCDCAIVRDTAMNTRFPLQNATCGHNDNRCLYYGTGNGGSNCDPNVSEANIATTELRAPALDTTIVMVNTARYGGCGGARAVYSAANAAAADIGIHELGHTLAQLADEYGGNTGCGSSAGGINSSTNAVNGAWPEWIADLGAPREGAQYYDRCIYRPFDSCEMRTLGPEFCPVCKQQWALVFFGHARVNPTAPLESKHPASPVNTIAGLPMDFSVNTRLASGPGITNDITWKLQGPGFPVPTTILTGSEILSGTTFSLPGVYTLTCKIIADTNLVKPPKYGNNVDTATWTVNVCAPGECCGNGLLEPGETCDDGNLTGGDCCSATCGSEPAGSACSDGNACTAVDLCAVSPVAREHQGFDGVTAPELPPEWLTAVTPVTDDRWTTTTAFAASAPNSATTNTPATVSDKKLDLDPFVARPGAVLEFDNRFNLESTYDGAVLELKIGGGGFTDIVAAGGSFVTGGYNATISPNHSSPIAGRAAWSGASAGFAHTKVNLPASAAGQTVALRFRVASDISVAAAAPNGQWIDNVLITGGVSSCQGGGPVSCDDANPCTDDSCNANAAELHRYYRFVIDSVAPNNAGYPYGAFVMGANGDSVDPDRIWAKLDFGANPVQLGGIRVFGDPWAIGGAPGAAAPDRFRIQYSDDGTNYVNLYQTAADAVTIDGSGFDALVSPTLGCVHTPIGCDDANACTVDSCDPGSGCVNTLPTPPTGSPVLTEGKLGGPNFLLTWSALPGATAYDLVYGFLGALRNTAGNYQLATGGCLANDFGGLSIGLAGDPGVGDGFWLLVRGQNCAGSANYDSGSPRQVGLRDAEIAASGNGCP